VLAAAARKERLFTPKHGRPQSQKASPGKAEPSEGGTQNHARSAISLYEAAYRSGSSKQPEAENSPRQICDFGDLAADPVLFEGRFP
jgi:hypothetical protein